MRVPAHFRGLVSGRGGSEQGAYQKGSPAETKAWAGRGLGQRCLVVPLTSRLHVEGLPGNVRLDRKDTRLSKPSVANVYDVQKVLKGDFVERVALLPADRVDAIRDGLRLVLDLG